jgi:hypothetical protein
MFAEELLPDRSYYNLRSGANMEIFYMGYADPDERYLPIGVFDDDNFSDESFVSAVADFEKRTKWTYSGQTDIIFLNSFFTAEEKVALDFTSDLNCEAAASYASALRGAPSCNASYARRSKPLSRKAQRPRVHEAVQRAHRTGEPRGITLLRELEDEFERRPVDKLESAWPEVFLRMLRGSKGCQNRTGLPRQYS